MSMMRLLLLLLLGLMVRRLFRSFKGTRRYRAERPKTRSREDAEAGKATAYTDLTEQGIDDADFEEIP